MRATNWRDIFGRALICAGATACLGTGVLAFASEAPPDPGSASFLCVPSYICGQNLCSATVQGDCHKCQHGHQTYICMPGHTYKCKLSQNPGNCGWKRNGVCDTAAPYACNVNMNAPADGVCDQPTCPLNQGVGP